MGSASRRPAIQHLAPKDGLPSSNHSDATNGCRFCAFHTLKIRRTAQFTEKVRGYFHWNSRSGPPHSKLAAQTRRYKAWRGGGGEWYNAGTAGGNCNGRSRL